MNSLKKLDVLFLDVKTILSLYEKGIELDHKYLGVKLDQRLLINQVLFSDFTIKNTPYSIFADLNSYKKNKSKVMDYFIEDVIILRYQRGNSLRTITKTLVNAINFNSWSESENINYIESIENAKNAFYLYTLHLKKSIQSNKLAQSEAHSRHIECYKMLNKIFNDSENIILGGIRIIPRINNRQISKSTEEEQKYHFNFYYKLFNEIADFIIDEKKYPFKIELYTDNKVWILPTIGQFNSNKGKKFNIYFDGETGKIKSLKRLKIEYKNRSIKSLTQSIKTLENSIDNHNIDNLTDKRIEIAIVGMKAYFIHFLSVTAMNDSTAGSLKWNHSFSIEKNNQKYKNIKYRAGNKIVEFQMKNKFIKGFYKFLKLRDYLLNGEEMDFLFFSKKNKKTCYVPRTQLRGGLSSTINKYMIENIDSELPKINSRQNRVNKSSKVFEENGLIATSQLLQSSPSTIVSRYLGESEETTAHQFSEYFEALNKSLFNKSTNHQSISIGRCKEIYSPKKENINTVIEAKCEQAEGCLFCKNYRCHADDVDIRKLYSLLYIINESKYIAKDITHFEKVYGVVIDRIMNILEEIKKIDNTKEKLIKEIKNDVFNNENLDFYWEHKLNTLIEIGVL